MVTDAKSTGAHSAKKYAWIALALLVLAGAVILTQWQGADAPDQAESRNMERIVREAFAESHATAVANVEDDAFTAYVAGPLQHTCPFYVPDGVTYRQCLYYLVERQKTAYKGSGASAASYEKYCESISDEYTGIEQINLYQSCLAYKFSSK